MPANRSWHDYNESLVERGRVLIDIGPKMGLGLEVWY